MSYALNADRFSNYLARLRCGVCHVFRPARGLDARHELLDVLYLGPRGHEHGIGGFHDHHVMQTQCRDQPAVGVYVGIDGVLEQHIAARHVALFVGGQHFVQRRPGTHVVPARVERHHDRVAGLLHHRVVHRFAAASEENCPVDAREIRVAHRQGVGACTDVGDVRRMKRQLVEETPRAEHEHAGIPEIFAGGDEFAGACQVGLFHETRDGFDRSLAGAAANVAVTRLRRACDDAKGHQFPGLAGLHRESDGRLEGL